MNLQPLPFTGRETQLPDCRQERQELVFFELLDRTSNIVFIVCSLRNVPHTLPIFFSHIFEYHKNVMDELPANASKTIPPHRKMSDQGAETAEPCPGGEVVNVMSDVGLFYGSCPSCAAGFVYLTAKNSWMPESEFEKLLTENPPDVRSL